MSSGSAELVSGSITLQIVPQIDSPVIHGQTVEEVLANRAELWIRVTDKLNHLVGDPSWDSGSYATGVLTRYMDTTQELISDLLSRSDLLQGCQAPTYLAELLEKAAAVPLDYYVPLPGATECFLVTYALQILAALSPVYKAGAIRALLRGPSSLGRSSLCCLISRLRSISFQVESAYTS
jgi:hypothetical protein